MFTSSVKRVGREEKRKGSNDNERDRMEKVCSEVNCQELFPAKSFKWSYTRGCSEVRLLEDCEGVFGVIVC